MCQEETTMCTVTMEHRDLNHLLQAFQDATETLHSLNCVLAPVSSARRQKETLQDLSERRENVLLRISPSTQKENGQWNSADLAELSAVLRGEAKLAQQHNNLLRRMLANEDGDVGVSANEGREAASRLMEQLQIEKQARIDAESAAQRQEWIFSQVRSIKAVSEMILDTVPHFNAEEASRSCASSPANPDRSPLVPRVLWDTAPYSSKRRKENLAHEDDDDDASSSSRSSSRSPHRSSSRRSNAGGARIKKREGLRSSGDGRDAQGGEGTNGALLHRVRMEGGGERGRAGKEEDERDGDRPSAVPKLRLDSVTAGMPDAPAASEGGSSNAQFGVGKALRFLKNLALAVWFGVWFGGIALSVISHLCIAWLGPDVLSGLHEHGKSVSWSINVRTLLQELGGLVLFVGSLFVLQGQARGTHRGISAVTPRTPRTPKPAALTPRISRTLKSAGKPSRRS